MHQDAPDVYERIARKIACLYLSTELPEDEPVNAAEVLDALILEARDLTGGRHLGRERGRNR
jgi:hypothetical protein